MSNKELLPLIKEIQNQNMSHFGEVYAVFEGLVGYYGTRLCYEDAKQELTLFLIELLYEINTDAFLTDNSEGLKRYVAVSLRNKYILLSKQNQKYNILNKELSENTAVYVFEPEIKLSLSEGLKLLSARQRAVIVYRYVYDYSDFEISGLLGISRQAVNRLKNRGLEVLKNYYGKAIL